MLIYGVLEYTGIKICFLYEKIIVSFYQIVIFHAYTAVNIEVKLLTHINEIYYC